VKLPPLDIKSSFRADPNRLESVIPLLHDFYDYVLTLPAHEFNAFSGVGWSSLIQSVILSFRLSFPIAVCPEWDDAKARRTTLRFAGYLDRLCRMGSVDGGNEETGGEVDGDDIREGLKSPAGGGGTQPGRKSMDVLSASKVVLAVVRKKFLKRVAKLDPQTLPPEPRIQTQAQPPPVQRQNQNQDKNKKDSMVHSSTNTVQVSSASIAAATAIMATVGIAEQLPGPVMVEPTPINGIDRTIAGCPMMDGSLEPFYQFWDETFMATPGNSGIMYASMGHVGPGAGAGSGSGSGVGNNTQEAQAAMNNDLWGMMTMGWAQNDINFDEI
jgi:hypothetical protein